MDMSEYDMVSVSNVYIDNADEDSEASFTTEFLTDTSSPHNKTTLSNTSSHSVKRNKSNSGGTSSDTIVIIDSDSDSEEELPSIVPQRSTDQHPDPWLNAFNRKIDAQQKDLSKNVPTFTKMKRTVDDCVIVDENSVSNDALENKVTTSPEADLGYCEGDDVDDNMSIDNGIHKTPTTNSAHLSTYGNPSTSGYPLTSGYPSTSTHPSTSGNPSTSGYPSTSEFTAAPTVSKSPTVGRKAKQNRKYYCTECRAIFSELHEHDQTFADEQITKRFTCDFCHEEFFSELDYSSHGQSCARRCTCHFCGHVFNEIVQLKQHLFTEHAVSKDNASTSNEQTNASPNSSDNFSEYSTFSSDLDTTISEPVEQQELVDSTKFPCNMCSSVFSNACNLKRHTTTKHSRRKKGQFRLNISKRQNKRNYSSAKSNLVTKPVKSTKRKVTISQQQKSTCDFCQKQFISGEEYSTHCKNCTIRCTCPFCGTTFQAMKELRRHMFTQHDLSDDESESTEVLAEATSLSSKFSCSECGMSLSTASNLQRHVQTQHLSTKKQNTASKVKPRFYCSVCNMSLYTAKSFRKHQRKHLTKTVKSEECRNALSPQKKRKHLTETVKSEECRNALSPQKKRKHLTETVKSEDKRRISLSPPKKRKEAKLPEKKHKCYECGVCLSNFHNLKRHKQIHTRNKTVSLSNKAKAKSPEKLDDKKKIKKFRCGICGDYFNLLFNLERHAMTHSEPTPYQCQVCFTRFSELQHLQCHFEKFHIMDS